MAMKPIARAHPWFFSDDAVFPVVSSDQHPLKMHARGLLGRGILSAIVLHFLVFGSWFIQRGLATGELPTLIPPDVQRVVKFDDFVPPPPIQPQIDPAVTQPEPESVLPSVSGVPEAVPDFAAPDVRYQGADEWVEQQSPIGPADLVREGESIVVDPASIPETDPDPGEFVVTEEQPYPVVNPAPVYPDMARAAEVEGVVVVRAMVNKEGRIEKAFVVSGHPMLDEAALAAVRSWVFKPAMQQHRPVKVWVTVPIRFVLH